MLRTVLLVSNIFCIRVAFPIIEFRSTTTLHLIQNARISVMSGVVQLSFRVTLIGIHTTHPAYKLIPRISLFPQVIPLSPAACLLSPGHFLPRYRSGIRGNSSGRSRYRAFTLEQSYLDDYLQHQCK